jgi:urease accessory protein
MRRAIQHRPAGHWPADQAVSAVTLAFDQRHRRRILMVDDGGEEFMLDLPRAAHLNNGDGLALDGGGFLLVKAAEEAVADVRCGTPEALARIAWHIGNRHMPVQVLPDGVLRVPDDHILVAMLEGLGARVVRLRAPFAPESGAYHGHHDHD